eukprot:1669847-Prymnesium_polylepis.1
MHKPAVAAVAAVVAVVAVAHQLRMNPAHAPLYGSQIPQPNPAQSTATSSQTQTTSLGVDAPSFEEACPGLYRLALAYVRERSPAFIGSNSSRAWLPEAPGVTTLARVLDATEE